MESLVCCYSRMYCFFRIASILFVSSTVFNETGKITLICSDKDLLGRSQHL